MAGNSVPTIEINGGNRMTLSPNATQAFDPVSAMFAMQRAAQIPPVGSLGSPAPGNPELLIAEQQHPTLAFGRAAQGLRTEAGNANQMAMTLATNARTNEAAIRMEMIKAAQQKVTDLLGHFSDMVEKGGVPREALLGALNEMGIHLPGMEGVIAGQKNNPMWLQHMLDQKSVEDSQAAHATNLKNAGAGVRDMAYGGQKIDLTADTQAGMGGTTSSMIPIAVQSADALGRTLNQTTQRRFLTPDGTPIAAPVEETVKAQGSPAPAGKGVAPAPVPQAAAQGAPQAPMNPAQAYMLLQQLHGNMQAIPDQESLNNQ